MFRNIVLVKCLFCVYDQKMSSLIPNSIKEAFGEGWEICQSYNNTVGKSDFGKGKE